MYFVTATFIEVTELLDEAILINPFDKVKLKVITPFNLNLISRAAVSILAIDLELKIYMT